MATPVYTLLVPALGALLLLLGAVLVKLGHWPRRTGAVLHCAACDYILTGAETRCPECGTAVSGETVVRGRRRRRPALTASGVVLTLFGLMFVGVFLAGVTGTIDWNRHKPLGWLLRDLDSPTAGGPAWAEIRRRFDDGLLSEANQDAIVEKGLQRSLPPTNALSRGDILDFIGTRYLDHKLTESQAERFFGPMMKVSLSTRPVVGAQSAMPYSLRGAGRGPQGWWLRVRTLETQVDDGPVSKRGGGTAGQFGGWSTSTVLPPIPTPGKHRLRVKVEFATSAGPVTWNENAPVARRVEQDLFADVQVVEGQTPIETVTTPDADALARNLRPRLSYDASRQILDYEIDTDGFPVDAAFEVFARFDGHDHSLGTVTLRKNVRGGYSGVRQPLAELPAAVDLVFRASESAARDTVDLTQIWKGEIVLPNVPVTRVPARAPATAPAATQSGS